MTDPGVSSPAELLVRLGAIQAALPTADGVAHFNRMYQLVTSSVDANLGANTFVDPDWMAQLDAVFGNLYLDAVRASVLTPDHVPGAWAPLFERRFDAGVAPLQFAFAGMNAHINRDLAVAVVNTCKQRQTSPDAGSHHADFERVNVLLAQVEPTIRRMVEPTLLGDLDTAFPGVQDVVANFNMGKARETAWTSAESLWVLDQFAPDHGAAYLSALDHLAGLVGRGLLIRTAAAPS